MAHYSYTSPLPQQAWPPYYIADPYRTTPIPHHFPEHHYPLEHTRHTLVSGLHSLGHAIVHPWEDVTGAPVHCPRADVQESEGNYYVDVEFPGVERGDNIKVKWISSRTFLIEATLSRPATGEEAEEQPAAATDEKKPGEADKETSAKPKDPQQKVYLTLKERPTGTFARAFSFATAVDHALLEAHLEHGLLRLKIPKVLDAPIKEEYKTPEVKEGARMDERAKI